MSELLHRIALTKIPKVGAITSKKLIAEFGSAEAVFHAKRHDLIHAAGVGDIIAEYILSSEVLNWAEKELRFVEENNIKILFHTDDEFPHRLRQIHDCPMLLYYSGNADLNTQRIVAVVGTRKPTNYGTRCCENIVEELKEYNTLIISGLAYGIDIIAHRQCVNLGIPTIGIMGNGLQRIYPNEHRETAHKMMENGGLLTEYPSDQSPDAMHFPMRNRLIAAMCDALVVVETPNKGGSMITANLALQYDRDLFAVPGRADDRQSKGCNDLIRRQKAILVESAKDIAHVKKWDDLDAIKPPPQMQMFIQLSDNEQLIIDSLNKYKDGAVIDILSYDTLLSQNTLASVLLQLEFKGLVKALVGKRFVRI